MMPHEVTPADGLEQEVMFLDLHVQEAREKPGRRLCEFCGRFGWKNYLPYATDIHGAPLSWMCSSEGECRRRLRKQLTRLWADQPPGRVELAEAVHRAMWRAGARRA